MTREEETVAEIMALAAAGTMEIINAIRSAVHGEERLGNDPEK